MMRTRKEKIQLLKELQSGKKIEDALPLIWVALLPVPEARPNLISLVTSAPSSAITHQLGSPALRQVKEGGEQQYIETLKGLFPDNKIVVDYGMTAKEFDLINSQLEAEY